MKNTTQIILAILTLVISFQIFTIKEENKKLSLEITKLEMEVNTLQDKK